jgi:hypothetical protein
MVVPRDGAYPWNMTITASPPSASLISTSEAAASPPSPARATAGGAPSRTSTVVAAIVLAGFGAFSIWVVATQGYTGFLSLAGREPWGLQMLLDLVIALTIAFGWLRSDARRRGIAAWPFFIVTIALGSIGILGYCVRRAAAPVRPGR